MIGRDVKKIYRNQCHNNGTKVLTIVGNATKYLYFNNLNFKLQCPGLHIQFSFVDLKKFIEETLKSQEELN